MSLSFAEAFQKLEEGRQRRAVWATVVDYLNRYVDTEVKEVTHGIPAEGCVAKAVSQALIEEVIQSIEVDKISPLDEEISTLENLKVVETKNEPKNKRTKAAPKKNKKAIRVVPRAANGGDD